MIVAGAAATPLVTTRAERSVVVEQTFVNSIPLNVRNPLLMINSAVGVTPAQATTGNNSASQSATNTFQINGTKATTSDQQIDGAANLVSYLNQVAAIPQVDAVEEFRVVTSAYRAGERPHQRRGRAVLAAVGHQPVPRIGRRSSSATTGSTRTASTPTAPDSRRPISSAISSASPSAARCRCRASQQPDVLLRRLRGAAPAAGRLVHRHRADGARARRATSRRRATPNGNLIVIYDPRTTRLDPTAPAGTVRYVRDPFPGNRIPADAAQSGRANILQ